MNKQELLKQADYNFQRGNNQLAKKYLAELISAYPDEEAAWVLLARIVEEKEHKVKYYQRVIMINPNNSEAKIALARIQHPNKIISQSNTLQTPNSIKNLLRGIVIFSFVLLGLGTTTYAIAKNNPESTVAKLIIPPTLTSFAQTLPDDVAAQTRADISKAHPEYSLLMDTLIGFAINSAASGMEGAPERPGEAITFSESAGTQAKTIIENALPQPGSLTTITLTEQEITSWLAMEMIHSPDLPLSDVQIFLRDGTIQIWGLIVGNTDSTSALLIGKINTDATGNPSIKLESFQIGQQTAPDILLAQTQNWLNQLLAEGINQQMPGLQIMNINIDSGLLTISGMR